MQGKHATMVSPLLERAMLGSLATTRSPARHHVLFRVFIKAGLRATAMASLLWTMVTEAQGQGAEMRHVPKLCGEVNYVARRAYVAISPY